MDKLNETQQLIVNKYCDFVKYTIVKIDGIDYVKDEYSNLKKINETSLQTIIDTFINHNKCILSNDQFSKKNTNYFSMGSFEQGILLHYLFEENKRINSELVEIKSKSWINI